MAAGGVNKNNYLCVALPDELRASLSELALGIAAAAGNSEGTADVPPTGLFDPVDAAALHMTYCFLGPSLQRTKRDAVLAFRDKLQSALTRSGDGAAAPTASSTTAAAPARKGKEGDTPPPPPLQRAHAQGNKAPSGSAKATEQALATAAPPMASPFALRPSRLVPFPPDKCNLLAAVFDDVPAAVRAKAPRAHAVAAAHVDAALSGLNSPDWLPHVTLGKLRGPPQSHRAVFEAADRAWAAVEWPPCQCDGRLELCGHPLAQAPDVVWSEPRLL